LGNTNDPIFRIINREYIGIGMRMEIKGLRRILNLILTNSETSWG
jgi:hypothetical protein